MKKALIRLYAAKLSVFFWEIFLKKELDVKGLKCPLPVLKVQKAMKELDVGDQLEVIATDPLSVIDVPAYCQESGHKLVSQSSKDDDHVFLIECA